MKLLKHVCKIVNILCTSWYCCFTWQRSRLCQKTFLYEVFLSDCFWWPLCWWEHGGSFAALQAQACSLALAFHTRSAVKACDRPQTPQPTAPLYPRCLTNYEFSTAMKVILSDMQLSSHIVSVVLFVAFKGRISQGRHYTSPLLSELMTRTDCKMT